MTSGRQSGRLGHLFEIQAKKRLDMVGLALKRSEGIFDSLNEVIEGWEVFEVSALLLDIAPQEFNRIEIGRIAGQLKDGQAVAMTLKEETGLLRGVIVSAVLDQEQRDGGLLQDTGQKGDVGFGFELVLNALEEDLSSEELDETEDFVGAAFAGGADGGPAARARRTPYPVSDRSRRRRYVGRSRAGGFRLEQRPGSGWGHRPTAVCRMASFLPILWVHSCLV